MGLEIIKQLNVHYYNNQLSKFNIDQLCNSNIIHLLIPDAIIENTKRQKYFLILLMILNYLLLKKKYQIKTVNMYDRTIGIKEKSIIIDHVNRSGVFYLKGNTPHKQRPMFPDMSYIYEKDPPLKSIIVQTLGYSRFKKVKLEERVFFSEAAAIIATIWHYVGVSVRGFAIPTK